MPHKEYHPGRARCRAVLLVLIVLVPRASEGNFSLSTATCFNYTLDASPDEKLSALSPVDHATVDFSDTLFPGVVYQVSPNVSAIRFASPSDPLPLDRFHLSQPSGVEYEMPGCSDDDWIRLPATDTNTMWKFDPLPDAVQTFYFWYMVENSTGSFFGRRLYRVGNGCSLKLDGSSELSISGSDIPPSTSPRCPSFVFEVISSGLSELTVVRTGIDRASTAAVADVRCDAQKLLISDSSTGVRRVLCDPESRYYPWHLAIPVTGNFTIEISLPELGSESNFQFAVRRMDCNASVRDSTGSFRIRDFRRFVEQGCELRFFTPSGYVRHASVILEPTGETWPSGDCEPAAETRTRPHHPGQRICFPVNATDVSVSRNDTEFRLWFDDPIDGAVEVSYWTTIDVRRWSHDASGIQCAYGWIPYGQLCLAPFFDPVSWDQANADCTRRGAALLTISAQEQESFVSEYLGATDPDGTKAFWIGATDRATEGTWLWSDGKPVKSHANWFSGWSQGDSYLGGSQPSDDGLSNEDCVEIRRNFRYPGLGYQFRTMSQYFWNDRNCDAGNPYICQTVDAEIARGTSQVLEISLSPASPTAVIKSPNFPSPVGPVQNASYLISAPAGFRITLSFNAFDLEDEKLCRYDYLEIYDDVRAITPRVFCGGYSDKLKLLSGISLGSTLLLRLTSDHSYDSAGFSALVSIHKVEKMCEGNGEMRDDGFPGPTSCYWLISYPKLPFEAARQLCREYDANLTSIESDKDDVRVNRFIHEFGVTEGDDVVFWVGGHLSSGNWVWENAAPINYSFYIPRWKLSSSGKRLCLSYRMRVRKFKEFFWSVENCGVLGGAICRSFQTTELPRAGGNLSMWISEEPEGSLRYPGDFRRSKYYANSENVSFEIIAPSPSARLVVRLESLDVEFQRDCLYDYLHVADAAYPVTSRKFCGNGSSTRSGMVFRSRSNAIAVNFVTDESVVGHGFHLRWTSFDHSSCRKRISGEAAGTVERALLPMDAYFNVTCSLSISVPREYSRIVLMLEYMKAGNEAFENRTTISTVQNCFDQEAYLKIFPLNGGSQSLEFRCPGWWRGEVPLVFVSISTELTLEFPHDYPMDFRGSFQAVSGNYSASEEHVIIHRLTEAGELRPYNHPLRRTRSSAEQLVLVRKLLAPLGWKIIIRFAVEDLETDAGCLLIQDPILETLGRAKDAAGSSGTPFVGKGCPRSSGRGNESRSVESFMHQLVLRDDGSVKFYADYNIVKDDQFAAKSLQLETAGIDLSSCDPNPCVNNGTCAGGRCTCPDFFKGFFCQMRECEENPCLNNGKCLPLPRSFRCSCSEEFTGSVCETKIGACLLKNPCRHRGNCTDLEDGNFKCSCRPPWDGNLCEREVLRISYKPLSKRMLEEPFWLGMITVASVLSVISSVWCIKRRFADKLDKLMSEQIEKSKFGGNASCELSRASSVREMTAVGTTSGEGTHTPTVVDPGNVSPGNRRKLLGRFSFRKPSVLSLSSNGSSPGGRDPNRSFSLEDFLRRSSRTPSPRRLSHARPGDTGRMDSLERKRLLKSLLGSSITRVDGPRPDKGAHNETDLEPEDFNMEELAHLGERLQILLRPRSPAETDVELYFPDDSIESNDGPATGPTATPTQKRIKVTVSNSDLDPKLERRVTFAKMVNQVCKELTSSSSEIEGSGADERKQLGNNDGRDDDGSARAGHFPPQAHAHQHPPRRHRKFRFGGGRNRAKGLFRRQTSVSEDRNNADVSSSDNVSTLDVATTVRRRDRIFGKNARFFSGNSSDSVQEDNGRNQRARADSNDSVLSLSVFRKKPFRRSSSSLASPLGSEADDSSAVPTPISTPGSPTGHGFAQQAQANQGLHREGSASSLTASAGKGGSNGGSPRRESSSEDSTDVGSKSVEVPVVTIQRVNGSSGTLLVPHYVGHQSGGHIMLEYYDGDMSYPLSPIKEVPTPMISPCPTPRRLSTVSVRGRSPTPSRQGTIGDDDTESEPTMNKPIVVVQTGATWATPQLEINPAPDDSSEPNAPAVPEIVVTSPTRTKPPPLVVSSSDLNSYVVVPMSAPSQEEPVPIKLHVPFDTAPRSRSQSLEFPRGTNFISANGDEDRDCCEGGLDGSPSTGPSRCHHHAVPTLTITPSTPPGTPRCASPVQIITVLQEHQVTQIRTSPVPIIEISSPPRTPVDPSPPTPRVESRRKSSVTFDLPPMKSNEDDDWGPGKRHHHHHPAPKITVTAESDDTDPCDLAVTTSQGFKVGKRCAPAFLSPFGGACTPRTTSESNLSSSGYSSMASPSSSRSGSVKTICEPESPGAMGHKGLHHVQTFIYRVVPMKPMMSSCVTEEISLHEAQHRKENQSRKNQLSDEATTTDTDYGAEHDSAIDSSDNLDFKSTRVIRESFALRGEKISEESCASDDERDKTVGVKEKENVRCSHFVIPAIVIDTYSSEEVASETDAGKKWPQSSGPSPTSGPGPQPLAASSPTSPSQGLQHDANSPSIPCDGANQQHGKQCWNGSRSESPLSENGRCFIYCPQFFNSTGKELLYTDSDGLYDCPSSEVPPSDSPTKVQNKQKPGRRLGKKREKVRKSSQTVGKSQDAVEEPNCPNNDQTSNVKSPNCSPGRVVGPSRRKSPKKRVPNTAQALDSSSSMESLRSSSSGTRKSEDGSKKSPTRSKRKANATPRTSPLHTNSLERAKPLAKSGAAPSGVEIEIEPCSSRDTPKRVHGRKGTWPLTAFLDKKVLRVGDHSHPASEVAADVQKLRQRMKERADVPGRIATSQVVNDLLQNQPDCVLEEVGSLQALKKVVTRKWAEKYSPCPATLEELEIPLAWQRVGQHQEANEANTEADDIGSADNASGTEGDDEDLEQFLVHGSGPSNV